MKKESGEMKKEKKISLLENESWRIQTGKGWTNHSTQTKLLTQESIIRKRRREHLVWCSLLFDTDEVSLLSYKRNLLSEHSKQDACCYG